MSFFCLKFFLTAILFSLIIAALFIKYNKHKLYSNPELILYSLGLGPIVTVLLLYYLLLLFPYHTATFYTGIVFLIYALIAAFSINGFRILLTQMKRTEWRKIIAPRQTKIYWIFVLVLLLTFLFLYLGNTLQTPIEQHDALIYGNLGKMYYVSKTIPYEKLMKDRGNGFYFQGSQKPSFSLLLTWEMMLNPRSINRSPNFDLFFRSITGYYSLLMVAVMFLWLYRKNKYLALLGMLVLLSSLSFMLMILNYHLDSYRLFFLSVSWIWLAYSIRNSDGLSLFLLGIFSGFTAFAHPIGLIVAVTNIVAFFIFYQGKFASRLLRTATLCFLLFGMGNLHYFMEIVYGSISGWASYIAGS
ncbi:MAG: hypothetical protein ACM3SY_15880 [Candidatus Omnitrophota bacterium]